MLPDIRLKRSEFVKNCGFKEKEFDSFISDHPNIIQTGDGYQLFHVISTVVHERRDLKKLETKMKMNIDKGINADFERDMNEIELELKRERMIKERISNQVKMSTLIPIDEYKDRVTQLMRSMKAAVQLSIQMFSSKTEDRRKTITKITKDFINVHDLIEEQGNLIKADAEGSNQILRTRLARMDQLDKEFNKDE